MKKSTLHRLARLGKTFKPPTGIFPEQREALYQLVKACVAAGGGQQADESKADAMARGLGLSGGAELMRQLKERIRCGEMRRRLARLGAERVTPEAVRAAGAALDRGEEPIGRAADFARDLRAFLLFAQAQTIGGGELTEGVIEHVQRDGSMRVQPADLDRARAALAEWHRRYGVGRAP